LEEKLGKERKMDSEHKKREGTEDVVKPGEPEPKEAAAKEEAVKQPEYAGESFSWGERVGYGF
jgi:hypothetical protein